MRELGAGLRGAARGGRSARRRRSASTISSSSATAATPIAAGARSVERLARHGRRRCRTSTRDVAGRGGGAARRRRTREGVERRSRCGGSPSRCCVGPDSATGSGRRVRNVLVAALVALIVSLIGTPFAIKGFRAKGYGQLIRDDGPTTHHTKRGTPTMGGTVIIAAILARLSRRARGLPARRHRLRHARAVPDDRPRPRRVHRRLHQDPQAAQPRADQGREVRRPGGRRGRRSASSRRISSTATAWRRPRRICRSPATTRWTSARSASSSGRT